jgi:probable O-glycosylation ligase (exosortase A-associated)
MKLLPLPYWIVAGLAVITAIGTYERSALIGIVVLAAYMWARSRHKFAFGIVAVVVGVLIVYTTSSAWNARVSTIGDYAQENSALTRILVWRWTLEFSATHPLGGAFQSYLVNHIEFPPADGLPTVIQFGRAFHSIYFEMLGEQGYPGIGMLFFLVGITLHKLRRIAKEARAYADMEWVTSLSDALQSGIVVFLTCGAFVGVMFQPMFWYFIAMSISLNAYMWRARRQEAKPPPGWRGMVAHTAGFPTGQPGHPGWRGRPAGSGITVATPPR